MSALKNVARYYRTPAFRFQICVRLKRDTAAPLRPLITKGANHVTGDYRSQRLRDRGERWPHRNRRRFPVRRHFMESALAGRGLRKLAERAKGVDPSLDRLLRGVRRRAIRGEADEG